MCVDQAKYTSTINTTVVNMAVNVKDAPMHILNYALHTKSVIVIKRTIVPSTIYPNVMVREGRGSVCTQSVENFISIYI